MAPLLSILLPTYNCEQFLSEQLLSILSQSFSDFELLMVDDGSNDRTPQLGLQFKEKDRRIRILPSSGNIGQRMRLKQLKSVSIGKYVAFSDQDDIWSQTKLERMVDQIGGNALAFGRSELVDGAGRTLSMTTFEAMGVVPGPDFKLRSLFRPLISAHCTMVAKEVITDEVFSRLDPFDWLIFLDCVFSGGGVAYVDEAVVYHRIHGKNQSNGQLRKNTKSIARMAKLPRWVLRAGYVDRFSFLKKLEHLASSRMLSHENRSIFASIYRNCIDTWLLTRAFVQGRANKRLRTRINDDLYLMAGSEVDGRLFKQHIDTITSGRLRVGRPR